MRELETIPKTRSPKRTEGEKKMKGQKKDGTQRKSTKGVPRITDKVIAMDETSRKAWLDKVPAEHRKDVTERLEKAIANGLKPRKVNFGTIFNGRTVEELTEAQTALTAALANASVTEEAEAQAAMEKIQARLDAIKTAREKVAAAAVTA